MAEQTVVNRPFRIQDRQLCKWVMFPAASLSSFRLISRCLCPIFCAVRLAYLLSLFADPLALEDVDHVCK
jgi:hypothetical protein